MSIHIGNQVVYTYCSDISRVKSTLDHFVIFNELSNYINKHCVIEDIENRSDHVPICVDVTLPIIQSNIKDTRHFIPKPKWHIMRLHLPPCLIVSKPLVTAAQESITFTQPYSKPNRTHPGWNECVTPFQSEALHCHSVGLILVVHKVVSFMI